MSDILSQACDPRGSGHFGAKGERGKNPRMSNAAYNSLKRYN